MNFTDPLTGDPINTPCAQTDGEIFFSLEPGDQKLAKQLCAACPITARNACLQAALDHEATHGLGYRHGIWGGRNAAERSRLADRRAVA